MRFIPIITGILLISVSCNFRAPHKDRTASLHNRSGVPLGHGLKKIWNPSWFQGNREKQGYFEGWYFKITDPAATHTYAIIPGISIHGGQDSSYAFIQLIDGASGHSEFIRYPVDSFRFATRRFAVGIADNYFSSDSIVLDIRSGAFRAKGSLSFHNPVEYPVSPLSPGIMGWYRFVPRMECYHGIVSMQHGISGTLVMNDSAVDFTGGKGYIEKDWGTSMPRAWIWVQCNHFPSDSLSLSISLAHVPWRTGAFSGFLAVVSSGSDIYSFTTYSRAGIDRISLQEEMVMMEFSDKDHTLKIDVQGHVSGKLKAPVHGAMARTIRESIGASVRMVLKDRQGNVIIDETGTPAGFEQVGDMDILLEGL
jgi:hypothetical protein